MDLDLDLDVDLDLLKKRQTLIPRIESADALMSVGASRPLEDAARMAYKDMVRWVQEKTGMNEMDAYLFVSQNVQASIVQMVDPQYTVLVKLPKNRLPPSR